MELAELQTAWSLISADIQSKDTVSEQVVEKTMHRRSHAELASIKRALQWKFLIGSVTAAISFGASLASVLAPEHFHPLDFLFGAGETTLFYTTLTASISVMLGFNYRAYRAINLMECQAESIKNALREFIRIMEAAIRFNIYSDTFMSPIFFTWFYYAYTYRELELAWDIKALILLLLPIVVGVVSFYFQKYMQHLKFGRYLERLKTYWESLNLKKVD